MNVITFREHGSEKLILKLLKTILFPKLTYNFNTISIKILPGFSFGKNQQADPNIHIEIIITKAAKVILKLLTKLNPEYVFNVL